MRIVHVINRIEPSLGGPPAVVARLASAQAAAGHGVCIATHVPACSAAEYADSYGLIEKFGAVDKCYFDRGGSVEHCTAGTAAATFGHRLGRPDFVHIHGLWRPLMMRAAWYCRSQKLNYAITPHGELTHWALAQRSVRKRLALLLCWRPILRHARFIHFLNENERTTSNLRGVGTPTVIVPNGVNLKEFSAVAPVDLPAGTELTQPYILFIARLGYYKGPDLLVRAFERIAARFPEVHLVIAGDNHGYEAPLRSLVADSRLAARIHVLGGVYGAAKVRLLRNALCLCHPTRHEGFSVTLLEALAASRPIVTTVHANFPELQTSGAGLVTTADPAAIATALEQLLSDESARIVMGATGLQLAASRYDWSVISLTLVEHYARSSR